MRLPSGRLVARCQSADESGDSCRWARHPPGRRNPPAPQADGRSRRQTLPLELQWAKHFFALAKALNKLDRYALRVIDNIGNVRKDEAETSVLAVLVMHLYECRSF